MINETGGGGISLTVLGPGTIVLQTPNIYSLGTTLGSAAAPPPVLNGGTLSIQATGSLGSGGVTFAGNYTLEANPTTSPLIMANAITVNSGVTATIAATANKVFALTSPIANASGTVSFGSATDTGVVAFAAANTYTGATVVNGGTVVGLIANAFSAASATTVNTGGTLDLGGFAQTVSSLAGAGTVTNSGASAAILTNQGASSTFAGVIKDGASTTGLTQNSAGNTLTLAGANTYSGPTLVSAGTLKGGAAGAFSAASATTVSGGAFLDLGGFAQTVSSLAGAGTVTNSGVAGALLINQGASSTFAGVVQDGASVTGLAENSAGNTLTLTGANTYSGPTFVIAGTLKGGAAGAFSAASAMSVNGGAFLDLGGFAQTVSSLAGGGTVTNSGPSAAILVNQGASSTFAGVIKDGASATGLAENSAGNTLTLAGANTYSGPTFVIAGTLKGGATDAFSAASATSVNGGAFLDLGGFAQTVSSLAGGGTVTNSGASAAILTNQGGSSTFAGVIQDGASPTGLTQDSAGNTLTLTGANTYSGPTLVSAGTLKGGAAGAFSAASATTVNGGAFLDLGGFAQSINTMALAGGTIQDGNLTGTVTSTGGAISANLVGTTTMLTTTAGTTTLTGANTYAGGTTISAGSLLQLGDGGAAGSIVGNVTDNGALAFDRSDTAAFPGVISGPGGLMQIGSGTTVLTAANTFTGLTTISGGTLSLTGSLAGPVTNSAIFENSGAVGGLLTNSGTATNSGALNGGVANSGSFENMVGGAVVGGLINTVGISTNDLGGTIDTATVKGGTLSNSGSIAGAVANMAIFDNNVGGAVGGLLTNSGTATNSGALDGGVANSGSFENMGGGAVVGGLINTVGTSTNDLGGTIDTATVKGGTLSNSGSIAGTVANMAIFNNNVGGAVGGLLTNSGTATNSGALDGGVANSGSFENMGGGAVVGGLTNSAGASTNDSGGTIDTATIKGGALWNTGSITGAVTNWATFNNNPGGVVGGLLTNNSGATTTNGGALNGGVINSGTFTTTNLVTGGLTNSGVVNASGAISGAILNNNPGTFNIAGNLNNSGGTFTNNGTVLMPGSPKLTTTTFNNNGVLDLRTAGTVATNPAITGNYVAQGGAQVMLNVNAVVGNTGQEANFLKITGNASGGPTTVVVAPLNNNPTLFPNLIPIISVGGGGTSSSFVAANGGVIPGGLFGNLVAYGIMQQGNTYDLFSHVNVPAIGPIAGSIGAAISSATTGFFQGSTAFLGQPANATPNQIDYGVWTRGASGMNSDKSVVTSSAISTPTDLKTDTHFSGYQVGSDVGMFNIQNSGWNLHAGITGGEYVASASEANFGNSNSSYTVPFLGLYAAVTGHGFYADALVRHDFWNGSVTSQDAGITNASMNGNGNAATVEAGYRYDLPNGFFVTPSAGFAYTRATFSPLTLLPGSPSFTQLALDAVQSDLGRLGLQVGDVISTTYWTLIPNVNVSVWHEFAGDIPSVFTVAAPGQSVFTDNLSDSRVGTFGQFGVGLAVQPVQNPNYTGYIRVDYRTGSNINGATLTGGFRYQF